MTLDKIQHIVVLMLENRSFDSMLGMLYPKSDNFDGLSGDECNVHGNTKIHIWNEKDPNRGPFPGPMNLPDPDPGEKFTDIDEQLFGIPNPLAGATPTMEGFAKNYAQYSQPAAPDGIMHYYLPEQVPMISALARNYAVCDAWFASAPCQTWPNRFFLHTATAGGYENNEPVHFPYLMPTIFTRFNKLNRQNGWKIYYHDMPHSSVLSDLWHHTDQFHHYDQFKADAASGNLPSYSFIEPRYYTEYEFPNDQHPPHDIRFGEELIADVYNSLQASPAWKNTLLIITYDEHGGCYDHVPPPSAIPPEPLGPGQVFAFDRYGVRVPAIVVSPYIKPGTVFRAPQGSPPYDHTSVIATLRNCFDLGDPLTDRDRHAPDLSCLLTLSDDELNLGGPLAPSPLGRPDNVVEEGKTIVMSDLQKSLVTAAAHLPDLSGNLSELDKIKKITHEILGFIESGSIAPPDLTTLKEAVPFIRRKLSSFLSN